MRERDGVSVISTGAKLIYVICLQNIVHSWFLPNDSELAPHNHNHAQAPDVYVKETQAKTSSHLSFP